jgi:histidinol phosphatase-like enzyme (inositol monophosphatase family)
MAYERELDLARCAAVAAGGNARRLRENGIVAEAKADESPVTIADRENEIMIREAIERGFPDDGILGEEGASKQGTSGRRWIIDPIDGTRDYVRGNRFWCVLIALEQGDESLVGVAHFPMLAETYWAVRGEGAYCNDERLQASSIRTIEECVVAPGGLQLPQAKPVLPKVMELAQRAWGLRCFGGALDACLVASGKVDLWFEPKVEPWDLAPLRLIIEEAGGAFIAVDGSRSIYKKSAIGCAPGLAAEARRWYGIS